MNPPAPLPVSDRKPRVVMLVANDVSVDTRVKKTALTLAAAGLDVVVIGLVRSGGRSESQLGQVRLIRLPVPPPPRKPVKVRRRSPLTAAATKQRLVATINARRLRQRELEAAMGRVAGGRGPGARIRRLWLRWFNRAVGTTYHLIEDLHRRRLDALRSGTTPRSFGISLPRRRRRSWRTVLPEVTGYELAMGAEIDAAKPDVIHAHDVHVIGIAERAAARARHRGRDVRWVYDAHEYVPGLARYDDRVRAAWVDLESEYIDGADRVVTVSPVLADRLQAEHGLPRRPDVVLNVPIVASHHRMTESVRTACRLPEDVPLVVYSGGFDRTRGVHTLVDAIGRLPDVVLALVAKATSNYLVELLEAARRGGFDDRIHLVPFVAPDQVVSYVAGATLGVHPLVAGPENHEVALPNKLFEYLHAGLPVVVSDCRAMAELVTELGVGEVFASQDPADLAAAIQRVLDDPGRYRRAIAEKRVAATFSWSAQGRVLRQVYADLVGPAAVELDAPMPASLEELAPAASVPAATRTGGPALLIGPRNSAGQAWAWARAAERCGHIAAHALGPVRTGPLQFPSDSSVSGAQWRDLEWQLAQARRIAAEYSHVIVEGAASVLGDLNGGTARHDAPFFAAHDIATAVVLHGSEIRDPQRHRELMEFSPFVAEDDFTDRLTAVVADTRAALEGFAGPVYVTTPDLLAFVPDAVWLPVVVDLESWAAGSHDPLQRRRPIVVHVPSRERLKGSSHVDAACRSLERRGVIDYRRLEGVPRRDMPAAIGSADIVVDGVVLGAYGTLAVEAMAAGRVVVGDVSLCGALRSELPIVHAKADSVEEVIAGLIAQREQAIGRAAEGPRYVAKHHDGRYSWSVLAEWIGEGE